LLLSVWVDVEAIEVSAEGVHSEVAVEDSVDVDHGHHHKDEHLAQQVSPQVSSAGQKVNHSFHSVGGRGFSGVHSGGDQHYWLFEAKRTRFLGEEGLIEKDLVLLLLLVMGSDSEKVHRPSFGRMHQNLFVEIQL
jgi:hypothetical protein